MALIACRECRAQISDQAHACPRCGAPLRVFVAPKKAPLVSRGQLALLLGFAVFAAIGLLGASQRAKTAKSASKPAASAEEAPAPVVTSFHVDLAAEMRVKQKVIVPFGFTNVDPRAVPIDGYELDVIGAEPFVFFGAVPMSATMKKGFGTFNITFPDTLEAGSVASGQIVLIPTTPGNHLVVFELRQKQRHMTTPGGSIVHLEMRTVVTP